LKPQQTETREPSFAGLMSFRIHTLAKTVDQHAEASHRRESGLGLLECRIVGVVGAHGPLSFKALCELAELEKSNASRLVARLIELGFVERQEDPSDQRSFFVVPTAAGRKLRRAIHRNAQARNDAWLSVLSAAQKDQLSTCLRLLQTQARAMLQGGASAAAAARAEAEGPNEPARLAWIDRQVADQLYALLGTALDKPARKPPSRTKGNKP
jgi:DNA-binding MarR family transcriptional regulator